MIASVAVGVISLDGDGRIIATNEAARATLGRGEAELLDVRAHDLLHEGVDEPDGCSFALALQADQAIEIDGDLFRAASGELVPASWLASPLLDRAGVGIVFRDDTAQRVRDVVALAERDLGRAELAVAQQSVADLQWLAELTQTLSSTLDDAEVLRRLARLVVGRLADVAIVDLVDADGHIERIGGAVAAGVDVDVDAVLARTDVTRTVDVGSSSVATVVTGQIHRLTGAAVDDPSVLGPSSRVLLRELDARSVLIVPLAVRERIVGALVLVRRQGSIDFDELDELVAADIGRRAALAVDNGRLYRAQSEIALELQHALLPQLTAQLAVDVAVRYLPAFDQYEIGGDWYDVFHCPDNNDRTILIIGDVAGHDLRAATTMAALRNLLRGVAVATSSSCAGVVEAVDGNLDTLGILGTASSVVMTIEPSGDQEWTITWSNAGHPPPVLIGPDGEVSLLEEVHGPILGTRAAFQRRESSLRVAAGSTIVLYTDGLVERREEDIEAGLLRLKAAAKVASGLADQPEALIDELVRRSQTTGEDDTALLVCHLPNPAQARSLS